MNVLQKPGSRWDLVIEALILSGIEVGEHWEGPVSFDVTEEGVLDFSPFDAYTRDFLIRGNWVGELPEDWQSWPITVNFELAPGKYVAKLRIGIAVDSITIELLEHTVVEEFEEIDPNWK